MTQKRSVDSIRNAAETNCTAEWPIHITLESYEKCPAGHDKSSEGEDEWERAGAAAAKSLDSDVDFVRAIANEFWLAHVRGYAAKSPLLTADDLRSLAQSKERMVLAALATRPDLPRDVVSDLFHEHYTPTIIRANLAANAATPPDIIAALATDSRGRVLEPLLKSSRTPPDILDELARSQTIHAGKYLPENPSATMDSLLHLMSRGYEGARDAVFSRKCAEWGISEGNLAARERLLALGVPKIVDLSVDADEVQIALALHPNATNDTDGPVA